MNVEAQFMSTQTRLRPLAEPEIFKVPAAEPAAPPHEEQAERTADRFSQEQIRMLVRQLFFSGAAKPARHVVFSPVDETTYVAEICMDVAKALADQVSGSVCVMEGNGHKPELETIFGSEGPASSPKDEFGFLRSSSQNVCGRLWLAPSRLLFGSNGNGKSPAWLQRRLSDFRLEFDYTILHAPSAVSYGEAAVLGHLSDGVVLVLEADATRRAAALTAKNTLQLANARVLGTVLTERTFPIPEGIYRRL
jgi:hypothetical protein